MDSIKKVTYNELLKRKENVTPETDKFVHESDERIKEFSKMLDEEYAKTDKVLIVGDYDCDGICSSYILKKMYPKAEVVIGDRFIDGYGIPKDIPLEKGTLVIFTDMGSSDRERIDEVAIKTGIKPFIIDHHEIQGDFRDYRLLNFTPNSSDKFKEFAPTYCSTGLAYKMVEQGDCSLDEKSENTIKALAGIGTVADVVPVNNPYDDNRYIILQGFDAIQNAETEKMDEGLAYLLRQTKMSDCLYMTTEKMQFNLIPIFNASGRLEVHGGQHVFDALISNDKEGINHMIDVNEKRKEIKKGILESDTYKNFIKNFDKDANIAVFTMPMPQGITGIIASQIVDALKKPAIVLTENAEGNLVGSGRNQKGFPDMYALCEQVKDTTIKMGGHSGALGLSLVKDNLDIFKDRLTDVYKDVSGKTELEVLDVKELTVSKLMKLEPFGEDFPKPVAQTSLIVTSKNNISFSRPRPEMQSTNIDDIKWKTFDKGESFDVGEEVTFTGQIGVNEWRKSANLEITITDVENHTRLRDEKNVPKQEEQEIW